MTDPIICFLWDNNDRRFQSRRYHTWDHRCGSCGRKVVISEAIKHEIDQRGAVPVFCEQCALTLATLPTETIVQAPRWTIRPTIRHCELCTFFEKRLDEARLEVHATYAVVNPADRMAASRRWEHLSTELNNHLRKGECSTAVTGASRSPLNEIGGSHLSSVEFVHDYIQFHFDGPCLTTFTLPSIKNASARINAADPGYRDALCSQIGTEVEDVVLTAEELQVRFADSVAFVVSLRNEDYVGLEAINYMGKNGGLVVI